LCSQGRRTKTRWIDLLEKTHILKYSVRDKKRKNMFINMEKHKKIKNARELKEKIFSIVTF
jgi:hypothetical protein